MSANRKGLISVSKILVTALAATTSSLALAQSVPPTQLNAATVPQAAPATADGIEDSVVTATRREERLQLIPDTVKAVTGNALKSSGIIDTRQLTQVVPGLLGSRNAGVNQPVVRGIGSSGVSGDEANFATYIDGVYQADPYTTNLDLVEIDRLEVLRGPQGTVFGRNATGGLINVITPDPSFKPGGHVDASYGTLRSADDYDLRGCVTSGLSDTLGLRLTHSQKATAVASAAAERKLAASLS